MTNNNKRSLILLAVTVLLAACGGTQQPAAGSGAAAPDTVPVFMLAADTMKKTTELPAELIPYEQADLYARIQGFVRSIKVDIGDHVRKGQTLAVIEAPEVNTRVAESEAALEGSKAKWTASRDQYERLHRASLAQTPGIVAPVDLERSRNQALADSSAYEAARRQSQAYKEVSGYLYITAPFDGVITARRADPGALVGPSAMLLHIQNNRTLRLRVAVPEMYVAAAVSTKKMDFRVDAYPAQRFDGTLSRRSEAIDPATRTELWEYLVDNRERLLKAGAFAYVKLQLTRSAPSFMVPFSSIATTQEKKFVIKVSEGQAEWIDIRQGITNDKGAEVFGALKSGDTLLIKATDERKPGSSAYWKLTQPL
jgi:membrane fusion protein (multidrug efflux system)